MIELYQFSTGAKAEPLLPIDELLIYRLQEKINKLAYYYKEIIYNEAHKDKGFAEKLSKWFNEQGWSFYVEDDNYYEQVSHQAAYLLANKIIFYNALQAKRPDKLSPLSIPEDLAHGGPLKGILQSYFNSVLEIDYETIYTTDFIDEIAFPDSKEVVEEIKSLVDVLKRYKLSELGFDVIGRIFERLIPEGERHKLGQYFTDPDIVDLILQFCVKSEKDIIFDPSCGAGTFLVRAYQYKKLMNLMLTHEDILNTLWGNDIAKFPAHLSTINLAINDLSVEKNYPRIMQKDFFDLLASPEEGFRFPEDVRKVILKTMSNEEFEIVHPRWFDAIVGNPPYTRQEEISEISGDEAYKRSLIDKALRYGNNRIANISKRAGIYAYFFVHGTKFLKDGGRFGFIVSNSWLDVEYGAGFQEFFLENYKIIAIIESKVERWFEDADINTVIVILEKCKEKEKRNNNVVRFVYLLKPLRNFIPPAQTIWEKQIERKQAIDNLIKTILAHSEFYENDGLRIFTKKQSELWEEGFDPEEQKYVGSKWGKYLRAPEIFFKVLEKGKGKLVPLKKIANVRRGFTTGADPWFYVSDITKSIEANDLKSIAENLSHRDDIEDLRYIQSGDGTKWIIEKNYLKPLIRDPRDYKRILIDLASINDYVVIINEERSKIKGKLIEKYVLHGETKNYQMGKNRNLIPSKTNTCLSRQYWYKLPEVKPAYLFWQKEFDKSYRHYITKIPVFADQQFYMIYPNSNEDTEILASFLNSTVSWLISEVTVPAMGLGAKVFTVADAKNFFLVNPSVLTTDVKNSVLTTFKKICNRDMGSVFDELGASSPKEVSLDKVKPDRRGLDKIVMGDILGLTDEEQLEVYKAVVDLVKSRIEKSKSVGKSHKVKKGIDLDATVELIISKIGDKSLKKWYEEKILLRNDLETRKLPEIGNNLTIEKGLYGWKIKGDKGSLQCTSEVEAEFLKIWLEIGSKSISIPKDEAYLLKVTAELKALKKEIDDIIDSYLSSILDSKLKSQILYRVWQSIS